MRLTVSFDNITTRQPLNRRTPNYGNDAIQRDSQRSEFRLARERDSNHQVQVSNRNYLDPQWYQKSDNFNKILPAKEGLHNHKQLVIPQPLGLGQSVQSDDRFPLLSDFAFPQPDAVRPIAQVAGAPWVQSLRLHLDTLDNKQIDMVTSNEAYKDVLLNWLISATVRSNMSLSRILVISLDNSLHLLLQRKKIPSVFLPPESLLNPSAKFSEAFEKVMMIRLAVMRLLNYWGFDVANYDTDAIILKDPQPLYDDLAGSDIIGSVGKIPEDLIAEWGITICIGVVVLRSSERTGEI